MRHGPASVICSLSLAFVASGGVAKSPEPPSHAQILADGQISAEFKLDERASLSPAAKVVLARKLRGAAAKAKEEAKRYVCLRMARDKAAEGGDVQLALQIVEDLVADFDVDESRERGHVIAVAARHVRNAQDAPELVRLAEIETETSLETENFDLAKLLAEGACIAAEGTNLLQEAQQRRDDVAQFAQAAASIDRHQAVLEEDPENSAANLALGRYLCFAKADWASGLMMLALGADAELAAIAVRDLGEPKEALLMASLGDDWWARGLKEQGLARARILEHARDWYHRAAPGLSAPRRQSIDERLAASNKPAAARLATLPAAGKAIETKPVKASGVEKKPAESPPVPAKEPAMEEWIDLLAWAEEAGDWKPRGYDWNDGVEGKPTGAGITLIARPFNRFPLPAIIDGDYDLELNFIRHTGVECVGAYFPVGMHNLFLELGGARGALAGVSDIDGRWHSENPTRRSPFPITNGVDHHVMIRVRRSGDRASFKIDYDDIVDCFAWEGLESRLVFVDNGPWKVTTIRRPILESYENRTTFTQARLRMLSGTVQRDYITEADRKRDRANGLIRLVWEASNAREVGWGKLCVNQVPMDHGPAGDERLWPFVSSPDAKTCTDFYYAHAPSRVFADVPIDAKSFSVVSYNDCSRTTKASVFVDGKLLAVSQQPIAAIKCNLPRKSQILELVFETLDDDRFDQSFWCYPRFYPVGADRITDDAMCAKPPRKPFIVKSFQGPGGKLLHNELPFAQVFYAPLAFANARPCDEFIFAHVKSICAFEVPAGMTRFTAIGYAVLSKHVKFQLIANGKVIFNSPVAGIVPIDVKLPPDTRTLELQVDPLGDARDDVAIWCYPRLHNK